MDRETLTAGKKRVLILDDEELVLRSFARLLNGGHEVTALTSPKEALRRLAGGETWDAILCDLQMPELDGVEFYEQLVRARPEQAGRLAFITGGAFTPRVKNFLLRNTRPVAEKPLDPPTLKALMGELGT
jgi:CheY-like chemotaxis protein